uniref:hypothetical protein n=1 Tax=Algoriphagus locisalis TaxID=305507 RepID=UPI000B81D913|nr:hypothetical protein [Algoriphagus locisalis]
MKSSLPTGQAGMSRATHTEMIKSHARFHPVSVVKGQIMALKEKLSSFKISMIPYLLEHTGG